MAAEYDPSHDVLAATIQERDGWTIIRPGEASLMRPDVVEALGDRVESLVGRGRKRIILDFSAVRYISSSMIGVLVGARQSADAAGGQLILCSLHDRLQELLKITRLHRMFTVEPSLDHALKRVEKG